MTSRRTACSSCFAARVATRDPRYATANGIRVGSEELQLTVGFGEPSWKRFNAYPGSSHLNYWIYCFNDRTRVEVGGPQHPSAGKVVSMEVLGCKP